MQHTFEQQKIIGITEKLMKEDSGDLTCAVMLHLIVQELKPEAPEWGVYASLTARIRRMMLEVDESRFSTHDYADAIANARIPVDPGKLLGLDDDQFYAAMAWLAMDKRETYEDRDHEQAPLELDIWRDRA